ncbi:hypothetical protein A2242_00020 [Candidatus Falkowbacteria bacterium RIFOXYA2_FULL_47_9]|uniref:Uncharacterized protein n=1 Tax=Candidatus Falkowbacteria bacterium RIFOXYA2_FULL_47_9 TaxID=1797995 RepID=A0A1F5SJQ3_9BACT|nr:MAG: hypothetical protein A2242_00020 [Candidatus Falkowbacteria bacterium RIFOXYA2_FULL_47_9]
MFEYLQKFKNLSPSLREVVSSARATQVISELEKKYDVDLNALVIKIMVKEINWTGLSEFLAQEHHLAVAQAVALQAELAERLFKPATQYLGISPQKQLQKFSRQELEHELPAPVAPEKPQLRERQTLPAIQPVASAEQVEKISPQVLQKAGITDRQSVESVRLTSIMQTFFKGIRDSIDTRETLLKQKAAGGLALDAAKADAVMALLKAAKQGKVAAAPTIKKSASPFDSLEQIRDVEYKFPSPLPIPPLIRGGREGGVVEQKPHQFSEQELEHELMPPPLAPKSEFVISTEKLKQAERALQSGSHQPKADPPRAGKSQITNQSDVRLPRGKDGRNGAERARLDDILKPPAKMQGPLEELAGIDLTIFRRLGDAPESSIKKIENKIRLLEQESYTRRQQGVNAWRHSPVYAQYLALGQESFTSGRPVVDTIAARQKAGAAVLNIAEFDAIAELNGVLRV